MANAKSVFSKPIYLKGAVRTPIGKFGGSLSHLTAPKLATLALKEGVRRIPGTPDFVFLGHARQAGAGPNPARQATIFSGFPESVPAITVNQACASGMTAIFWGMEKLALGKARSVWSGGVESMSNTPFYLMKARWGYRMGHEKLIDGMYQDGFHCALADMVMGKTVEEFIAKERKISRQEQDEFACRSQEKAGKAMSAFQAETFEILPEGKNSGLKLDEHARPDSTLASLAKLPPVFDSVNGSVTAGNSSGITDGSAWVHLSCEKDSATQMEILDYSTVALDPKRMGLGPVPAVREILDRQNLSIDDIEAIEINEAFAAQVIACQRDLKIPDSKLNVRGGSIALGHPIGATGARIVVTLTHILQGKPGALGIATLCVSGGQGVAILLRAVK